MIRCYPKTQSTHRNTYKIVSYFLNRILENKIEISSLVNKDIMIKIDAFLLSRGRAYELRMEDDLIEFDKEIDQEFNEETKDTIRKIFKDSKFRQNIIINDKEEQVLRGKKFLYLYLIFLQVLSELAKECKDKANLLYKCFKLYFVEYVILFLNLNQLTSLGKRSVLSTQ